MTTIGLLAAKGSPGVTTLAAAMVIARADSGAALIEADRAGGDVALLHAVPQSPGLAELAARARRGGRGEDLMSVYLRPLARGLLPALLAPVDSAGAGAALDALSQRSDDVFSPGRQRTVVFDFGRVDAANAPRFWTRCDMLALVTRGSLTGLAHSQALARHLPITHQRAAFVLIDTGPYRAAEAEEALALPCAGTIPFAPKQAARLLDPMRVGAVASLPLVSAAGAIFDAMAPLHEPQEVLIP